MPPRPDRRPTTPAVRRACRWCRRPSGVLDLRKRPFVTVTVARTGAAKTTAFKLRSGLRLQGHRRRPLRLRRPEPGRGRVLPLVAARRPGRPPGHRRGHARTARSTCSSTARRSAPRPAATTHVYTTTVKPSRTAPLQLQVANTADRRDRLAAGARVPQHHQRHLRPADVPRLAAAARRSTAARTGTGLSHRDRRRARRQRQRAHRRRQPRAGRALPGHRRTAPPPSAAACRATAAACSVGGTWWSQASLDRRAPGPAHGRLYVDGVPFDGAATDGGPRLREPVARRRRTPPPAPAGSSSRCGTRWPAATTPARSPSPCSGSPRSPPPRPRPPRPRPRPRPGRSAATPSRVEHRHADRHRVDDAGQGRAEGHDDRARHLHVRPAPTPTRPAWPPAAGWSPRGPAVLLRPGAARAVGRRPARSASAPGRRYARRCATRPTRTRTPVHRPPRTARCGSPVARPRPPRQHRHPHRRLTRRRALPDGLLWLP